MRLARLTLLAASLLAAGTYVAHAASGMGQLSGRSHSSSEHRVPAKAGDALVIQVHQERTAVEQRCLTSQEFSVFAWQRDDINTMQGPAAQMTCDRELHFRVTADGDVTIQVNNYSVFDVRYTWEVAGNTGGGSASPTITAASETAVTPSPYPTIPPGRDK